MIWIAFVFHVGLIVAAYAIGRRGAGYGVALFLFGVVCFQVVVLGPSSLIDDGCHSYSMHADTC